MEAVFGVIIVIVILGVTGYLIYRYTQKPPVGNGTVDVRVTDKVDGTISSVLLTVHDIQASVSSDDQASHWLTLVPGPKTFDLVKVKGIEDSLGTKHLPTGQYRQLRMVVDSCTVTLNGSDVTATVPSGVLKLVHPFTVEEGKTTIVTIDFDANESLVQAGDKLQLKPVVKLLVRDSSKPFDVSQTFNGEPQV